MAPGIDIPVVPVMHEALRGDLALGFLVRAARVVADHEALAAQEGRADGLEMVEMELSGADGFDADAPLHFTPTDLPCAAGGAVSLETCEALVPAAVRQGIEAVAAGKGASAEAVLLAVFAVLLGKVTQQEQLVVEVPPERAIRFRIDDNMEFEELLAFTQKGLTDKAGMGDVDHGVSGLADDDMPLMQSALRLGFAFARGGVSIPDAQGRGYGLFCSVQEQKEGLALHFAYDPQQVGAETAQDWLTYYGNFLEGIIEGAA